MRRSLRFLLASIVAVCLAAVPILAQAPTIVSFTTPQSGIVLIPISSTAAVNNATVLTLPAPAGGLSNYVCYLAYEVSTDATGGALSNVVSTSANFNSFAVKFSQPAGVNLDSGVQVVLNSMSAIGGCPKSTVPGTATTFTAPSGSTHEAWTWMAVYFQAP